MQPIDHTNTIIELKNISFAYEKEMVLHDIDLSIHKGDYLGIIGPNGGGKSTLLKIMLGLLKPNKGNIYFYNTPIREFKDWPKIGYVSQHVTHFDENFPMTVEGIVMLGRFPKIGLFRFPTKKDHEIVEQALSQVEMLPFKKRLISELSGGQQQRVFIAKALALQPEIIVLDEPTVGIDVKTQEQFYRLLQKLNKELNLTLILVSHELDVIEHEATEIAYINNTLIYHGVPSKFNNSEYFAKLYGKEKK